MGIGDMVNQAKGAVGGDEQIDSMIDKAADAAKEKTPDQVDGAVDQAADTAKKLI